VLIKTLLVTEAVLLQAESIKESIGESWPLFLQHMQELSLILAREPNPEFTPPLIAALHVGFSSPAEPIIAKILENNGFDYRFITGQPRRFSALKPGKTIPPKIQHLWQQARIASQNIKG
jgi:hypothetical protein